MLSKFIYKSVVKDITKAYHQNEFTTQEWIKRIKSIYAEFEKYYPNETLMEN